MPIAMLFLSLAACGDAPPPPAPKVEKKQAEALRPKPVEAKAPEAPKPDPNKALAQRVKKALEDDSRIPGAGIDVTANDGVVTLWGTTASADQRLRAAKAAAAVEGVKSVDNKLTVVKGS